MSQSSSRLSRGSTGSSRDSNRSLYNLEQIILDVERAVQQARLNRNLDIRDINDLERQVRELTSARNNLTELQQIDGQYPAGMIALLNIRIPHLNERIRDLTNEINELRRELWKTPVNSRQTSPEPSLSGGYSSRSESQASTGRNHAGPSSPRNRSRSPVSRNYSRNYSSFGSNKKMESRLKRDLRQLMLI